MAAAVVKVPGLANVLPGYVLPPLSLGALEQLHERIKAVNGDFSSADQIGTVIDAAHAALRRNYPDLTREQVGDLVGLENMAEVFDACMDVSGLKRKAADAAAAGGQPAGE
jgi:hypothetical protein